jgi:hypothetical protein
MSEQEQAITSYSKPTQLTTALIVVLCVKAFFSISPYLFKLAPHPFPILSIAYVMAVSVALIGVALRQRWACLVLCTLESIQIISGVTALIRDPATGGNGILFECLVLYLAYKEYTNLSPDPGSRSLLAFLLLGLRAPKTADLAVRERSVPSVVTCWRCKTPLEVTPETRGCKKKCPTCGTKQPLPR